MKKLLIELIWPAAAGNVAWSLLTLVVAALRGDEPMTQVVVVRLIILVLLATYLGIDWWRTRQRTVGPSFLLFDCLLIFSIALLSIAAASGETLLEPLLLSAFIVAITGHLLGAWEKTWKQRLQWMATILLGPLVLLAGPLFTKAPWHLVIALGAVLVVLIPLGSRPAVETVGPTAVFTL